MRQMALLAIILSIDVPRYATAQVAMAQSEREAQVRAFLIRFVRSADLSPSEARYEDAFIDLNGDGIDEVVVYLSGPDWCGTGGCHTLVLTRTTDSYVLVGRIPGVRTPIRVLREKTHGWRILTAWVSGATFKPFEEEYLFNGKSYSVNGRRAVGEPKGDIIISGDDLKNEKSLSVEGSNR